MNKKTRATLFLFGINAIVIGLILFGIGSYRTKNPSYVVDTIFDTSVGYGIDFGMVKSQIDKIANTTDDTLYGLSLHTGVRFPEPYVKFNHSFNEYSVDCGGDETAEVRKISLFKYGSKSELDAFKKELDTDILNSVGLSSKARPDRLFNRLQIKSKRANRRLTSDIEERNGKWMVIIAFERLDGHLL